MIADKAYAFTIADFQPDPYNTVMVITDPLSPLDERYHKGFTMYMSVFGSSNQTVTFSPMGTSSFVFSAPAFRFVTVYLFSATHAGHGPSSSRSFFTSKAGIIWLHNIVLYQMNLLVYRRLFFNHCTRYCRLFRPYHQLKAVRG